MGDDFMKSDKITSLEKFKKQVFDLVGNEYTIFGGDYINNKSKISIRHNMCGHEYEVSYNSFVSQKRRCPICAMEKRKKSVIENNPPQTEFCKLVRETTNNEYSVLGKYINNKTKIRMRHNKCGHEYEVRPNDFQQGYRCPACSILEKESRGIKFIKKYLKKKKIKYEIEIKLDKSTKKFDFFIPEFDLIIEYDGSQHFKLNRSSFFESSFNRTLRNDWIKNKLCLDLNYSLLRIGYKCSMADIEKILTDLLIRNKFYLNSNCYYSQNGIIYNKSEYYKTHNTNYFKNNLDILKDLIF